MFEMTLCGESMGEGEESRVDRRGSSAAEEARGPGRPERFPFFIATGTLPQINFNLEERIVEMAALSKSGNICET